MPLFLTRNHPDAQNGSTPAWILSWSSKTTGMSVAFSAGRTMCVRRFGLSFLLAVLIVVAPLRENFLFMWIKPCESFEIQHQGLCLLWLKGMNS